MKRTPRAVSVDALLDGTVRVRPGEELLLSGDIYTARDQAHKRLVALLAQKKKLPVDLRRTALYYCGPTPARAGRYGACGPTTASRMDPFMAPLLAAGLRVCIGKGQRSPAVQALLKKHNAVYLSAYGGLGALYASTVTAWVDVAFPDLGPEAIVRLTVRDFPAIVTNA